jgi:hypothetical protein
MANGENPTTAGQTRNYSRRALLAVTGAGLVAGCGAPSDGESTPTDTEEQADTDTPTDTESGSSGGSPISPDQTITMDAFTAGWEATGPSSIEGETNPTLVLEEGAEYTVEWTNANGQPHNFVLWNSEEEQVGGDEELIQEEGQTVTVTFTASAEMVQYVCTVHRTTMIGDVQVQ